MSVPKQTVVGVLGLATNPNPLALPPGSCSTADNCLLRRPGVMSPMHGNEVEAVLGSRKPVRMFSSNESDYHLDILRQDGQTNADTLRDSFSTIEYTTIPKGTLGGTRNLAFAPGRTHMATSRDRHFLTDRNSPIVVETSGPTATSAPRQAGLVPPTWVTGVAAAPTTTSRGILLNNNYFGYRATFKRSRPTFELISAPTPMATVFNNTGSTAGVILTVYFDVNADPLLEGDLVQLYRTAQQTSINALGDDFVLVAERAITLAELAAGFLTVIDGTDDSGRNGTQLYTNSTQDGADKANFMPPPASDVAVFADTTFYSITNTWPAVPLLINGIFGKASVNAYAIGTHEFLGNATTGSHDITGIPVNTGFVVGQKLVVTAGFFPARSTVTAISGAGPYTITLADPATGTGAGAFTVGDTITVEAFKDGVSVDTGSAIVNGSPGGYNAWDGIALDLMNSLPGIKIILNGVFDTQSIVAENPYFTIWSPISGLYDELIVTVTNGQLYSGATATSTAGVYTINSIQDTHSNRIYYSKTSLPEAVGPLQYIDVGFETRLKMWPAKSALMVLATDGLWRVTGVGDTWDIQQVDKTCSLVHPDCVGALDSDIYAWVTDGLARIDENGSETISTNAVGPLLRADLATANPFYLISSYGWGPSIACDNYRKEVWLNIAYLVPGESEVFTFLRSYIYNNDTQAFTTQTATEIRAMTYVALDLQIAYADDANFYRPDSASFQVPLIQFNPITAGDKGALKCWLDVNLLFDNATSNGNVQFLFDGESPGSNNIRAVTASTIKELHSGVPRRCSTKTQLVVGCKVTSPTTGGIAFDLYGFTARYRVASDTVKT